MRAATLFSAARPVLARRSGLRSRPVRGTAMTASTKLDGAGGDVGSLRLRVVPGLGHHDDLSAQGGDPVSFRARIRKIRVLSITTNGSLDVGQPRLGGRVTCARGQRERSRVPWLVQAGHDLIAVLAEVSGSPARVQLRQVGLPGDGRPRWGHGRAQQGTLHSAYRGVAHEGADEDQAANEVGLPGRGRTADPAAMELPTATAGPPSSLDQRDDIAGGFLVAVGRERGGAVAVAAQVSTGDAVGPGIPPCGNQETVSGPQVAHAGHEYYQGPPFPVTS